MNYLEEYYNNYDEEGRLLSKHGQVEYLTTMKYIKECLEGISEPNILEVGAGTGRYSVTLAKQGLKVTAVELIKHNLDILKSKLDGTEPINAIQGNALDLVRTEDIESYNAEFPIKRVKLVASDGATNYMRPKIDSMDDDTFAKWVDYHFTICERQDLIGASHHTLDILQKEIVG